MATETLTSRPLPGAPFGIELGLDPSAPLGEAEQDELRRLFWNHGLLVLRETEMDYDEQLRLVGTLGPILDDGKHYVSNVRADGILGNAELLWHSDVSYTETPYLGVGLYGDVVDAGNTATRFVNTALGAQSLPAELRARVEGLEARFAYRADAAPGSPQAAAQTTRPVIDHHRETGQPLISVNLLQTVEILGVDPDEGASLLAEVLTVLYAPERVYEHWWQTHDLVIWDNQLIQHSRAGLPSSKPRTLRRVTLGTLTVEQMIPGFGTFFQDYYGEAKYAPGAR